MKRAEFSRRELIQKEDIFWQPAVMSMRAISFLFIALVVLFVY